MSFAENFWKHYRRQFLKNISRSKGNKSFFVRGSLVLIVTARCNFACKHCLRDFNATQDMSLEIAQKAVFGAKKYNFKNVALTGGEPFLYPKFEQLIELITENDYLFSIVTNGYNFKEFTDFLKRRKERISFIAFSVESTDKNKHDSIRREGSFERLLEDFRICREAKIPFRIVTAASAMNYDEIFNIALFAKKKGAQSLVMTTVLPCPRSENNKLVLDAEKREELFLTLRELPKIIKLPILIGADIRAQNNIKLCSPLNMLEVTIDMDGNLVQCCELSNYDSPSIYRNAIITSLKDKSFDDALKAFSEYLHRFNCMRIEDYKNRIHLDDIDFNSCFYCLHALETKHP